MISSSNFVAITRLVVMARKDPGTTSPFYSLLDPLHFDLHVVLTTGCLKKGEYKEGKFHRHTPNKFPCKSLTFTEHSLSVFVTVTVSVISRF